MKTLALLSLAAILSPAAHAQTAARHPSPTANSHSKPVVLDRVIAIVNGKVLLQSDVDQEKRLAALSPLNLPYSAGTDAEAARRLIRRTLVLEQMKQQDQPATVSKSQAKQGLKKLRSALHACAPLSCSSRKGWDKFLKDHGITQQEALARWSQRLAIEKFINLRFRAGIHITHDQVAAYYKNTLVPALRQNQVPVPPLKQIAPRIDQLLLEQHVNSMINQWLQSLRAQGSVQILVPAYGGSTPPQNDTDQ